MRNKKAQEEMVGFIMIMLVVAVIFLIFLGISLRKSRTNDPADSVEVAQFLESIVEFTSDCSLDNGFSYKKLDSLARECEKNTVCDSGETACEVLEEHLSELVQSSWSFTSESRTKSFQFTISFPTAEEIRLTEGIGSCNSIRGADRPIGNDITFTLEICLD